MVADFFLETVIAPGLFHTVNEYRYNGCIRMYIYSSLDVHGIHYVHYIKYSNQIFHNIDIINISHIRFFEHI